VIVDASVGVKWLVAELDRDLALTLLERMDLAAPDLFKLEIGHLLGKIHRRRAASAQFIRSAWRELDELPVRIQSARELLDPAFELSCHLGTAIYDCVYLALAEATDDVLVTADERFVRTVRQAGSPELGRRLRGLSEFR
jgi:predicted nucleic acid-binding protein